MNSQPNKPVVTFERALEALASMTRLDQSSSGKSVLSAVYTPKTVQPRHRGEQAIYRFDNGYGASVVYHAMAYGGLELAVLHNGKLCYTSVVTQSVIGDIEDTAMLDHILTRIAQLPASDATPTAAEPEFDV